MLKKVVILVKGYFENFLSEIIILLQFLRQGDKIIVYDYHWDENNEIYIYDIFDPAPVGIWESYSRSYANI